MCAGAVLELGALVIIVVTTASFKSALARYDPGLTAAQWHGVRTHLTVDEAVVPVVIGLWLWLAWANNRGHDWARPAFMAFFGLITVGVLIPLGEGAAMYAPADLIAGGALWLVALTAMVLICGPSAGPYYGREAARPEPAQR
jgi:hypothetical protein